MTATTPIQVTRRGMSAIGAFALAVAGSMLVVAIVWTTIALVAVAAAVVFGAGMLESL